MFNVPGKKNIMIKKRNFRNKVVDGTFHMFLIISKYSFINCLYIPQPKVCSIKYYFTYIWGGLCFIPCVCFFLFILHGLLHWCRCATMMIPLPCLNSRILLVLMFPSLGMNVSLLTIQEQNHGKTVRIVACGME